jgi:hypothetical protein
MKLTKRIQILFQGDKALPFTPIVKIVDNTQKKYPWLESKSYLLVKPAAPELQPMLFTEAQTKQAIARGAKHPEDLDND